MTYSGNENACRGILRFFRLLPPCSLFYPLLETRPEISDFELKSFYYALNEGKIALSDWMENLMRTALSLISESADALILSVDDALTEKFGEKFEHGGKLYDHAAHNGSRYLNGCCFVSLMLSVPLHAAGQCLSFPVAYRMWTKERTKLETAAELVRSAMAVIGTKRQVILCCDSWHRKTAQSVWLTNIRTLLSSATRESTRLFMSFLRRKQEKKGVQEYGESACR